MSIFQLLARRHKTQYSLLENQNEINEQSQKGRTITRLKIKSFLPCIIKYLLSFFFLVGLASLSFSAGRYSARSAFSPNIQRWFHPRAETFNVPNISSFHYFWIHENHFLI